jgi:hypothetical protein
MDTLNVELHKARDAEECYAIRIAGEKTWRATNGFGSDFERIWTIEFQGPVPTDLSVVQWEALLDRAVEAFRLSDPIVTNLDWKEFSI